MAHFVVALRKISFGVPIVHLIPFYYLCSHKGFARCDALPDNRRSRLLWEHKPPDAPCLSTGRLLLSLFKLTSLVVLAPRSPSRDGWAKWWKCRESNPDPKHISPKLSTSVVMSVHAAWLRHNRNHTRLTGLVSPLSHQSLSAILRYKPSCFPSRS